MSAIKKKIVAAVALLISLSSVYAQKEVASKWGKITANDFTITSKVDTSDHAIVIAEIGNSYFEGNTRSYFDLIYIVKRRIKILNKVAISKVATVEHYLYKNTEEREKISNIKATTYNLNNGVVEATQMEKSAIFSEKYNNRYDVTKFTLPAVKEGSIIEYTYTVNSPFFFNLQPWQFQGEFPTIWSEYNVEIPEFFNFVYLSEGYLNFSVKDTKVSSRAYSVIDPNGSQAMNAYTISAATTIKKWVIENAPAIRYEPFTTSLKNHISAIEFQLKETIFPNQPVRNVMGDWKKAAETFMEREYVKAAMKNNNNFLDDDIAKLGLVKNDTAANLKKLYNYVLQNYSCTKPYGTYTEHTLKELHKLKAGNVAEVNLMLLAAFKHENYEAYPVLLSTRSNGKTSPIYPLMDRYDYVAVAVKNGETFSICDATDPVIGFANLPEKLYNGHGRIILENDAEPIRLEADELVEKELVNIFIINNEKKELEGSLKHQFGYFDSRDEWRKIKKEGSKKYLSDLKSKVNNADVLSTELDSTLTINDNVVYDINFKMKNEEDIIYFSPILDVPFKENPFKKEERYYPVEMPYTIDYTYSLNMEIPEGYMVDELPKSVRTLLNEDEGMFEYLIQAKNNNIQLRMKIVTKKANYLSDDYATLRDFFGAVIKKQAEQIVFKKKP